MTNIREAVQWLSYTYLYCRMVKNPLVYGLTYQVWGMGCARRGVDSGRFGVGALRPGCK